MLDEGISRSSPTPAASGQAGLAELEAYDDEGVAPRTEYWRGLHAKGSGAYWPAPSTSSRATFAILSG